MNRRDKIIKKNLITFLTIFDGKPNILADYLIEYNILNEKLISLLISNKELNKKSKELKDKGEIEKPYFSTIEEMQEFYNSFFLIEKQKIVYPISGIEPNQETLIKEIKDAITKEDYEMASKIRDYCITKNIDIKKYL